MIRAFLSRYHKKLYLSMDSKGYSELDPALLAGFIFGRAKLYTIRFREVMYIP